MTLPEDRAKWPSWARDLFEERAAMMEHHGEVDREEAERRAKWCVLAVMERVQADGEEE